MNALTDPEVEKVTWKKSARVGATKLINAIVGYYMHQDPCPILVVQPTVEDAEGYSKEEIAPMLRDCPALAQVFAYSGGGKRATTNDTILHKVFPGGSISIVGATSGRGFRRVSRKVVLFDEVDGYTASAGADGDQISLGIKRSEHYWDRKIYLASTPLVAGASRITESFEQGDQRYYYVPCPHCDHFARLVFERNDLEPNHYMSWPEGRPKEAYFTCSDCGSTIAHSEKQRMLERGEWRATMPFDGHASFHIWAGYSLCPNATWGDIAEEYVAAKLAGDLKLKAFYNTTLGETWVEKGDAPAWEILKSRRESTFAEAYVPRGAVVLTCGVDVQKACLYYEVVGWGAGYQSWSIEAGRIDGDTSKDDVWKELDALLGRSFEGADGPKKIARMCVDAGNWGNTVYSWCRKYSLGQVNAVRGDSHGLPSIVGSARRVDVKTNGALIKGGARFFPVGVDLVKSEFYGFLRNEDPDARGYCHFPDARGDEWFKQITAEHLVSEQKNTGHVKLVWKVLTGRENHWLDCRVYARAAASLVGLDRYVAAAKAVAPKESPASAPRAESAEGARLETQTPAKAEQAPRRGRKRERGWLSR